MVNTDKFYTKMQNILLIHVLHMVDYSDKIPRQYPQEDLVDWGSSPGAVTY